MSKVYVFLAEGFEEIEALTVVDLLRRAAIEVLMVSVTGNKEVTGSHQITTTADLLFEEVEYENADMLVLPGGMPGTTNLLMHDGLGRLLQEFNSKGKLLAAICAAPKILGTKGLLNGKSATCYPGFEDSLIGAKYLDTEVVADGNIVTSKGLGTAIDFSLSLIKRLKNEEEAQKIAKAIQYRYYT
ncbi:DJ-1/PfpI family protein [Mobilitalea sibirica]|uniref:DJ-1/PfpI family protein n=1 Tax=Mobilitalea sibirica TaxID=1462919 RepID=A0A8J7H642_9FIRM|nr:DJ-1 family glyoxalase III [Mobilitalea sibirica]MBH1940486.1 DJ-1/PfpI family protein [Mobilitalea sibirica]